MASLLDTLLKKPQPTNKLGPVYNQFGMNRTLGSTSKNTTGKNASTLLNHDRGSATFRTGPNNNDTNSAPGPDPYAEAQAAANAAAKAASRKQNENTRLAADAKAGLFGAFDKALKAKLANIAQGLSSADSVLLQNYRTGLKGLEDSRADNEKAEADSTFLNISNTLRERGDILAEVASQGAGETDALRAQMGALRNYEANQQEINRSYFDTLSNVNRAVTGLNSETITSRKNLYDRAEDDRDTSHTNYYNQMADAWNEIFNIENANSNVDSDSSEAYVKKYGNAAAETAKFTGMQYSKKAWDPALQKWEGQGEEKKRALANNKAQVINLGEAQRRPEGATLRKW